MLRPTIVGELGAEQLARDDIEGGAEVDQAGPRDLIVVHMLHPGVVEL